MWTKLHHFRIFNHECVSFVYQQLLVNCVNMYTVEWKDVAIYNASDMWVPVTHS